MRGELLFSERLYRADASVYLLEAIQRNISLQGPTIKQVRSDGKALVSFPPNARASTSEFVLRGHESDTRRKSKKHVKSYPFRAWCRRVAPLCDTNDPLTRSSTCGLLQVSSPNALLECVVFSKVAQQTGNQRRGRTSGRQTFDAVLACFHGEQTP